MYTTTLVSIDVDTHILARENDGLMTLAIDGNASRISLLTRDRDKVRAIIDALSDLLEA